jgi:hypothetical protein
MNDPSGHFSAGAIEVTSVPVEYPAYFIGAFEDCYLDHVAGAASIQRRLAIDGCVIGNP